MQLRILFVLFVVQGCGVSSGVNKNGESAESQSSARILPTGNPYFDPILEDFLLLSEHYLGHRIYPAVEINFGPTNHVPDEIGYCITSTPRQIIVNEQFWNTHDRWDRESMMFHEFGHCLLGRGHATNPKSLMYKNFVHGADYITNLESYRRELFTGVL